MQLPFFGLFGRIVQMRKRLLQSVTFNHLCLFVQFHYYDRQISILKSAVVVFGSGVWHCLMDFGSHICPKWCLIDTIGVPVSVSVNTQTQIQRFLMFETLGLVFAVAESFH